MRGFWFRSSLYDDPSFAARDFELCPKSCRPASDTEAQYRVPRVSKTRNSSTCFKIKYQLHEKGRLYHSLKSCKKSIILTNVSSFSFKHDTSVVCLPAISAANYYFDQQASVKWCQMSIPLHRKRQLYYFPLQQKPFQIQYNCPRSISRHKIKRNFGAESLGEIPKQQFM